MTGTVRGSIDPRYDARFQRGYSGEAGPDSAADPSWSDVTTHPPRPVEVGQPAERSAADDPRHEDASHEHAGHEHAGHEDPRHEDPELEDAGHVGPWLLGAWAVAMAALVIGAMLYWGGVTAGSYFRPPSESERWLQVAGWTVAPALIQAGLLGVVVLLAWSGIRFARRASATMKPHVATAEEPL